MRKILRSPFDIVAEALDVKRETLNEKSSMGKTPNWDSLNHVGVIAGLETSYEISIPDNEIMKYDNMKTIIDLYNKLNGNINLGQRIIHALKNNPIGKIFFK